MKRRVVMREARHGHQESDIDTRGVVWFGVLLILAVAAVAIATHVVLHLADRRPPAGLADRSPLERAVVPPSPRLQTTPPADMAAFRAHEDAVLRSAGWIDEAAGVARIPIDVAKARLLEKGLPVAEPPAPPAPGARP
jgi:hypothetical protein